MKLKENKYKGWTYVIKECRHNDLTAQIIFQVEIYSPAQSPVYMNRYDTIRMPIKKNMLTFLNNYVKNIIDIMLAEQQIEKIKDPETKRIPVF